MTPPRSYCRAATANARAMTVTGTPADRCGRMIQGSLRLQNNRALGRERSSTAVRAATPTRSQEPPTAASVHAAATQERDTAVKSGERGHSTGSTRRQRSTPRATDPNTPARAAWNPLSGSCQSQDRPCTQAQHRSQCWGLLLDLHVESHTCRNDSECRSEPSSCEAHRSRSESMVRQALVVRVVWAA